MAEKKKKTTTTKKTAAKKTTTKKSPAKKAAPKKSPAKKTSVKKAPAKKSPSKAAKPTKTLKYGEAKNSPRFAVIKLSGSQLKVVEGLKFEVKKLEGDKGDTLVIEDVLLVADGDKVTVGTPTVKGAKVTLLIDSQKKDKKMRTFKYKAKSRYRKTYGSRAHITRVLVKKIEG